MLRVWLYGYFESIWDSIPMHTKVHRHGHVISPYDDLHPTTEQRKVVYMAEVISTQIYLIFYFLCFCLEHKQNVAGSHCLHHAMNLQVIQIWLVIQRFRLSRNGVHAPKHFSWHMYWKISGVIYNKFKTAGSASAPHLQVGLQAKLVPL